MPPKKKEAKIGPTTTSTLAIDAEKTIPPRKIAAPKPAASLSRENQKKQFEKNLKNIFFYIVETFSNQPSNLAIVTKKLNQSWGIVLSCLS